MKRGRKPGVQVPGLLKHRTGAFLNQRELADKVGVGKGYISAVERGARLASITLVRRMAEALHVEPAELVA
jgi:transcriptional regulator with XRE-family HTH domain